MFGKDCLLAYIQSKRKRKLHPKQFVIGPICYKYLNELLPYFRVNATIADRDIFIARKSDNWPSFTNVCPLLLLFRMCNPKTKLPFGSSSASVTAQPLSGIITMDAFRSFHFFPQKLSPLIVDIYCLISSRFISFIRYGLSKHQQQLRYTFKSCMLLFLLVVENETKTKAQSS